MSGEGIQEPLLPEGPGRRLREARMARKLSRDDVARALRLKPQIITALEADDTAALPAPIYVNGYLRNYARLVGIPAEPLIEAYAQLDVQAPEVVSEIVKPTDGRRSRLLVRSIGILVFGAVLAGFLSWLQQQDIDWTGSDSEDAVTTITNEASPVTGQAETPVLVPAGENEPQPLALPELPLDEAVAPSAESAAEKAPVAPVTETIVDKQELSQDKPEAAVPAAQSPRIVLRLNADCWVQISDANGRRLVYDLLRAGQSREIRGDAPFKVFFGNAAGVSMEVNGQAYDFSQYINGNLARFTLTIDEDA